MSVVPSTCGDFEVGGRSCSKSVVRMLFEVTLSPVVSSSTPNTVFQELEGRDEVSKDCCAVIVFEEPVVVIVLIGVFWPM